MAIPTFLNTTFRYLSVASVLDVAVIITNFRAEVLALGWTEPSANLFKSPVDVDGRFMDILLTPVSTTRLGWRVRNPAALTICDRTIDIDVLGSEVRIFTGLYHAVVENVRATREIGQAYLVDESPDTQTSHSNYVVASGYRTSAGVVDALGTTAGILFALDAGVSTSAARVMCLVNTAATVVPKLTPSGDQIAAPAEISANMGGVQRMIGRLFQVYIADGGLAFDAEVTFPIDTATNAVFKVIGLVSSATGVVRFLIRKG
jgi:hypothetical protein